MRIIDMHCDTLIEGWRHPERSFVDGDTSINLKLLKENDSLVQFFAMYLSRQEMATIDPYDILKGIYAYYTKVMEDNRDAIKPVFSVQDIEKNREAGILSAFLTVEDGVFIDGKMERVEEVYDMGVRLLTLLWGYENSVGYPCSDDPEIHQKGLKPFGIEVVERMNELGMIIDVSHMSEGGFYDVAKYSKKPFVASHSCARALCNNKRNLTDDQLKTLGNTGGMVGINFECSFLQEGSEHATIEQIIQHLAYMKNKAGIEAIGFGSDFDGIDDNGELVNYSGFSRLLAEMEKTFTYDEIDKICSLNALRVIKDVIGK
ncbi:MAG: dipeptidase [Emergencia timonensis]|uniref:dipeptidase n=1 Tax=Emergencia timonensis TaxID=1776384 RepID=UPI00082D594F|nr:dipeptidase [Emergencia timonensis]WNX88764.1 dipeptidase [Emergencia timonensis]